MPAIIAWLATIKPSTWLHVALGIAVAAALAWVARVDHLRGVYKAEVATVHTQDQAAYDALKNQTAAASAQATASWQAKVNAQQETNDANAEAAQGRYADLHKQYLAAVMRAKAAAGRGGTGGTAQAANDDGAGLPQGSAPVSQLCVSDDDAAKIASLQAYAEACYEWSQSIVKAQAK